MHRQAPNLRERDESIGYVFYCLLSMDRQLKPFPLEHDLAKTLITTLIPIQLKEVDK